jgi:prepilin-type N-terminal cleavage/methylation domain-containing protein
MTKLTPDISRRDGFSVIEMLVSMTVLGILLSLAMPQIQRVRLMTGLASGQQAVGTALLRARWLAINKGQQQFVTLNGSNVLEIHSGSATGTLASSANLANYGVTVDSFSTFSFDPRGFLPTSTTLTLRQADLPATKTVTMGLYGKLVTQ